MPVVQGQWEPSALKTCQALALVEAQERVLSGGAGSVDYSNLHPYISTPYRRAQRESTFEVDLVRVHVFCDIRDLYPYHFVLELCIPLYKGEPVAIVTVKPQETLKMGYAFSQAGTDRMREKGVPI